MFCTVDEFLTKTLSGSVYEEVILVDTRDRLSTVLKWDNEDKKYYTAFGVDLLNFFDHAFKKGLELRDYRVISFSKEVKDV